MIDSFHSILPNCPPRDQVDGHVSRKKTILALTTGLRCLNLPAIFTGSLPRPMSGMAEFLRHPLGVVFVDIIIVRH